MLKLRNKKAKEDDKTIKQDFYNKCELVDSLEDNINIFREIFKDDDTFKVRQFENQQRNALKCCVFYIDGMVNNELVNKSIIQPVILNTSLNSSEDLVNSLQNHVVSTNFIEKSSDLKTLCEAIVRGFTVLFTDGSSEGLLINSIGWKTRDITEPETERIVMGPKEGFNESILTNLTLIRRKLETPELKMKFITIGVRTHTKICVCYMEGLVNHKILDEVYNRLNDIKIDSVLGSGYVIEMISDSPFSLLKTIGTTERPDIVAGKLLEGRIAVIVDGTPVAMTIPYLSIENFQANEDYYQDFYFGSIGRILRIVGFFTTISVPAIYLALVTYHQEAIPTPLLLSISAARQGVPFPTIIEISLLLFIFELLRETGIRMPGNVGQALSIVGALVLGTASVEAKIVSAPIVIVVSITAITGLMIPKIKGAMISLRIILLFLSAFIGLYGYIFGLMGLLIHLCEMRSFGVPYLLPITNLDFGELKDTAIRAPWWYLKLRPKFITANRVRQKSGDKL